MSTRTLTYSCGHKGRAKACRACRRHDLFAGAALGQRDLFSASIDDVERQAGATYRQIVAAGGTCPCGAHVKSWPWTDRAAGIPEPQPRVVYHQDDCPALIPPLKEHTS